MKCENIRFFTYAYDDNSELDLFELTENQFLKLTDKGAMINYKRHTVRENGVNQICLTADTCEYDSHEELDKVN